MATASVTYDNFINGTASDGDELDRNFADLVAFLNTEVVHVDGSKAMTGRLSLASLDPTGDDHAVRRSYLDDLGIEDSAWTTYTVNWSNFTPGNGTVVGRHRKIGKLVQLSVHVVLGSTSSLTSGQVGMDLPFTAVNVTNFEQFVSAKLFDDAGTNYAGFGIIGAGATALALYSSSAVKDTHPFTWEAGDNFTISGIYESA